MARGRLEDALGRLSKRWRSRAFQRSTASTSGPTDRADTRSAPTFVSLDPGCAYGVRYAQALEDLQKDLAEVKARLNGLLFLLAGAVAVEVVIKVIR